MISRFFIDRPIFATVLSVVITLIGAIALLFLPVAQYPRITPPGVVVSITYPGASARVVADSVAAPIEQQVNGVPGMLYMSSQMGNDGTYTLTVTFDVGVDLKTALVMVQNRVALAMPQLPIEVQSQGITIRKKTPDILMIVNFFSPDGRYDDIYLSNFATIYIKDQLLRLEGVSDINYQGQRDYSIRAWMDPQKLAAMNMTAMDVANAIRNQNLDAPAGQVGKPPATRGQSYQLPVATLGRLSTPEEFGDVIVKAARGGVAPTSTAVMAPPKSGFSLPAPGAASPITNSTPDTTAAQDTSGSTATSTATTATGNTASTDVTTSAVTSASGPATQAAGSSTGGGGTTTGGSMTAGGAMGGATDSSLAGLSINSNVGSANLGSGVLSGGTLGRGPGRPSASIVRLRDVARIEMGAQNYNQACTFDGKPSVGLSVYQLPGTNALEVAERVRQAMKELKTRFPDGVDYAIGYDTTPFIRESVQDVVETLLEAVLLVGLVVLVFLQDWRAMILPLIDVPVSIIGTFAVMAALGFSLNNISLFGLVLAIGIVVDDAIVVLENIERMMARGLDVRTATIRAMDEVTGPIVAVGLVLCAVFVPCAFISGITGLFFHQFAVTIAVSTIISAINAITMTPSRAVLIFKAEGGHGPRREALPWWFFAMVGGLLAVRWGPRLLALLEEIAAVFHGGLGPRFLAGLSELPASGGEQGSEMSRWLWWAIVAGYFTPGAIVGGLLGKAIIRPVNAILGWLFRGFNRGFDYLAAAYGWTVGATLRLRLGVLLGYSGLLVLTYWAFMKAPTGFIPQQDQGRLIVNIQLPDSASLQRTQAAVAQIEKIARDTKGVAHTVSFAGMSFILQATSSNFASMFIVLKPFDERRDPSLRDTAIMARMRKAWAAQVKDAVVTVYGASPIPGLGSAGGFKLVVQDRGGLGLGNLQRQTDTLIRRLRELPGLNSVTTQFRSRTPQLYLDIDRAKAAALGVSLDDVNQTLDMYLGSLYVNSFNAFGRHWQVTIQAEGNYRNRVEDINLFQVRNNRGQMVPLGTLVQPREMAGPITITRYNLYTSAVITGNVQGVSTGDAIRSISDTAAHTLPLTMKTEWTELMFMQLRAGNTAMYVFALSIVSVFLALSALYESWSLPLAVILVVPLCLLCSVGGVMYTNRDVNIFVQIGLVVLVGLACKNSILIVEYAKQLHQEGRSRFEATREASKLRLRPILMTSFAFIFGVIPLLLANGAGAEMRRSLGTAVFSGMLGVTLFGIFLTPVFFFVIQGVGEQHLLVSRSARWTASVSVGGLLGGLAGFLLGRLGVAPLPWTVSVGVGTGILAVLATLGVHRKIVTTYSLSLFNIGLGREEKKGQESPKSDGAQ